MREPTYAFFSAAEMKSRLDAVQERLRQHSLRAVILNSPSNIHYVCGYQTPGNYWYMALIVPAEGDPVLIPPPHEEANVEAFSWVQDYRMYLDTEDWIETTAAVLKEMDITRGVVGIERDSRFITVQDFLRLIESLPAVELAEGFGVVEESRIVKSEAEVAYMRKAAQAAVAGTKAGIEAVRARATELEVAAEVHRAQILAGSEYSGLPVILSSGPRSLLIHQTWSPRVVQHGEVVFFEVPGVVNRYHAAMTRQAYIGRPPEIVERVAAASERILKQAKAMIKPGETVSEVFDEVKQLVDGAGVGYNQSRRIAYSIGIAFPPGWDEGNIISINANEHRKFEAGMTFHLLATMHRPEFGGLGFSDTILVTHRGVETLTAGLDTELVVKAR